MIEIPPLNDLEKTAPSRSFASLSNEGVLSDFKE